MLKIGIIGCGKIADAHASEIQRIPDCRIVGVSDRELLMARQLAERFGVEHHFADATALLEKCRPDVVHITTPPQSHCQLGKMCLDGGSHIYVEKPFSLTAADAEVLLRYAEGKGRLVTVGHDAQFSHVTQRLRAEIANGYLGGAPVHMESYYCYNISADGYAKALLADRQHWVRMLPGQLLHNVISHGIARIAEYFSTDSPTVIAHGVVSPALRRLGEDEIIDELRVILSEEGRTAYFTFSSQMRPALNQFRIYGPKNGLLLDQSNECLIRLRGQKYKSYAEHFVAPLGLARQYFGNVTTNLRRFLRSDFHMKAGMKHLIEAFYNSIRENKPVPIPYREIVLTARVMDAIFQQIRPTSVREDTTPANGAHNPLVGSHCATALK
jgi:predicted dehydrogenase